MSGAECVVDCKAWLGEGPVWSPDEGCLYWTDVPSYTVYRWNPSTGEQATWKMPEMVASMAMRAKGGLILATTGGIDAWDPDEDHHVRLVEPEAHLPLNRSNDGKCDRRGRFWLGTMQNNLHPDGSDKGLTASTGNLYRIDADLSVHRMDSGIRGQQHLRLEPRRPRHVLRGHPRRYVRLRLRHRDGRDREPSPLCEDR